MSLVRKATAAVGCVLSAVVLSACGEAKVGPAAKPSDPPAKPAASVAAATDAVATTAKTSGRPGVAKEVADPLEAESYPAPASVKHASADAPTKAGEAIVAAGAPSDAEIRKELQQMQAVERSARRTQQRTLTPVPGGESIGGNGTIPIPTGVPEVVQKVIAGANEIADFPYVYGGGHASFIDNAYDCSGSVSYALAAGGLLGAPETSGELESWGAPGPGRYITVYANAGHTYMYVDGLLYDTAGRSGVYASRWQVAPTDNEGYVARHWPGL
jgi:cell wall-associated NlpC family hydrolase